MVQAAFGIHGTTCPLIARPLHRYENTERRAKMVADKGLLYMGCGVSGGEEGARNGKARICNQLLENMPAPIALTRDAMHCFRPIHDARRHARSLQVYSAHR